MNQTVATIAGIQAAEGKLYLCAIKDAFSNMIVGYSIDSRTKSHLVVAALENAVAMRGNVTGCVAHSDRLNTANIASKSHFEAGPGPPEVMI